MEYEPRTAKIVETELKQFAADLNLSETQKTQLRTAMEEAREKLDAIRERSTRMPRELTSSRSSEVCGSTARTRGEVLYAGTTREMGCRIAAKAFWVIPLIHSGLLKR
jgi:hypothetical protein